jgi:alkaline phosphatase D
MVGYSTMKEVMVWLQTTRSAKVHIEYHDMEDPDQVLKTATKSTRAEEAFITKLTVAVQPGKRYTYSVYLDGQAVAFPYPLEFQSQELWQWRHDPPAFSFATGSCNYDNEPLLDRPGTPYGADHFIFRNMLEKDPDFMVWMGDNNYLREADWNSRSGIFHRYTYNRSMPELQPFLGSVHHYATWDDHDYGPNNSDRSYWMKDVTLEAFKLFWANPNYGPGGGVSGTFFWSDVQFFMLDNRYFRTPNNLKTAKREMFGERQLQWLIDALSTSQAPFKFIVTGGQVLNSVVEPWTENYAKYPEEQKALFEAIRENNISGVFFLTGDRHMAELSKMEREGTYPLYDLTVSPLTAGPDNGRREEENNMYRVPGTYYGQRNFAILEVSGPRKERVLEITLFDSNGKEVWTEKIHEDDLK